MGELATTKSDDDVRNRTLMRWLVAACQCAAILLTWPLWQVRTSDALPPNLPVLDSALLDRLQVPFGEALLLTLVMSMLWPRVAACVHVAVLAASMVFDQMRIQPEFVSLAVLLLGTVARRGPLLVARGHLISLWFWAGMHKLLSPEYLQTTGPDLVQGLLPGAGSRAAVLLGVAAAAAELALALAALAPKTRRGVPFAAAALHGLVLVMLVSRSWNSAVWPWNLALDAAGYGFFAGWHDPLWPPLPTPDTDAGGPAGNGNSRSHALRVWLCRAALAAWLLYPGLYYFNACDGYLAWCVYAGNVPDAVIYDAQTPEGESLFDRYYAALNVPFAPATRLFEQYFRRRGRLDDRLEISDPRPLSQWRGRGQRVWIFTEAGPTEIHR